jgi:hypothetical protein
MSRRISLLLCGLALFAFSALGADDPLARSTNVFLGYSRSYSNWHGRAKFRNAELEWAGFAPKLLVNHLPSARAGVSVTYSNVRQPVSWYGYAFGEGDETVHAAWMHLFLRQQWFNASAVRPFIDVGSGPMVSNKAIPAISSEINFHSQLGLGLSVGHAAHPLFVVYRFSHISNGGIANHNSGWNLNTVMFGTTIR